MKHGFEIRTRAGLLAMVFICLWVGSVMTFGIQWWQGCVGRNEAIPAEAVFQSCELLSAGKGGREIRLSFRDYRPQTIARCCLNRSIENQIASLKEGTRLRMLLHPRSDTVLELAAGEQTILTFGHSMRSLRRLNAGYATIGVFMYACAALCVHRSLRQWGLRKQKQAANPQKDLVEPGIPCYTVSKNQADRTASAGKGGD